MEWIWKAPSSRHPTTWLLTGGCGGDGGGRPLWLVATPLLFRHAHAGEADPRLHRQHHTAGRGRPRRRGGIEGAHKLQMLTSLLAHTQGRPRKCSPAYRSGLGNAHMTIGPLMRPALKMLT